MYHINRKIWTFKKNLNHVVFQDEQISLYQDKIKAINERLDISNQKLIEFASMPDIEEQLKDRMEALAAAQVNL